MISDCAHDENGKYTGGIAGDQTGDEWRIIKWYNRPWKCVLRYPDANVRKTIARLAKDAGENNKIGYDQGERYTFWQALQKSGYEPKQITTACEADCSSGVAAIVKAVGYKHNIKALKDVSIYLYTGNMRKGLTNAGFELLTDSKYLTSDNYLLEGDILLYDGHHVATNLTDGSKVTASGTPSGAPSKTPKWVGKVTASSLNVRTGAGTEYGNLKTWAYLGKDNLIDVCDTVKAKNGANWYYVRIAGKYYGYVSAKYITKA